MAKNVSVLKRNKFSQILFVQLVENTETSRMEHFSVEQLLDENSKCKKAKLRAKEVLMLLCN